MGADAGGKCTCKASLSRAAEWCVILPLRCRPQQAGSGSASRSSPGPKVPLHVEVDALGYFGQEEGPISMGDSVPGPSAQLTGISAPRTTVRVPPYPSGGTLAEGGRP